MLIYNLKPSFKKSKDSGNREDIGSSHKVSRVSHACNSLRQELFFVKIPFLKETF